MHWWDGWSWWAWTLMTIGMVAFWGLVAWFVVALVRWSGPSDARPQRSAEEVLATRLAVGDIDEREYEARLDTLRSTKTHAA